MGKCEYCGCWWIPGNAESHLIGCPHERIKEIKYRFKTGNISEQTMNDLINAELDK